MGLTKVASDPYVNLQTFRSLADRLLTEDRELEYEQKLQRKISGENRHTSTSEGK